MKRFLDMLAKMILGIFLCLSGLVVIGAVGMLGHLGYQLIGLQGMLGFVGACAALVWALLRLEP